MLGRLKDMFGSKKPSGALPRMKRVNVNRRFTLISLTGQGSMSTVHKAVDNEQGRTVCLKVQHFEKQAAANARSSAEQRPPEGLIASKIVHPRVVRTFDFGLTHKGDHFLVMEFIEGVSLQFIREAHSANLAEKLELLAQAAEGLAAVHQAGYIHHDIGPKNFLVDRDHQVKLIDFGLAIPNTPEFRKPGNRTGTTLYMAPELIRRETIDERIDIFAFGAMAFEFLTGRLPYDANEANSLAALLQRINSEPIDPARANPRLPDEVCDLLRKLTARRKEERWPKMSTLAEEIRGLPSVEKTAPKTPHPATARSAGPMDPPEEPTDPKAKQISEERYDLPESQRDPQMLQGSQPAELQASRKTSEKKYRWVCPKCKIKNSIRDDSFGTTVKCKNCDYKARFNGKTKSP